MNPLINAEIGMLYTTDSRFLAKIKYTRNPDFFFPPGKSTSKASLSDARGSPE